MTTIDSVLNYGIPILLIIIVLGFIWIKFIQPYVLPMLQNLFEWMKGKNENKQTKYSREIIYGD